MMGLLRLIAAAGIGAAVTYWLPKTGVLAATQELIAFLALLMAGLLPAMTLTATMLRGGGMSARRIKEYGGALELQMRFWAFLFASAGVSTFGISLAKIFAADGVKFELHISTIVITQEKLSTYSIVLAGSAFGVVIQRLLPAYDGLKSLLRLNVRMAELEAIVHDRTLRDEFADQAANSLITVAYKPK